MTKIIGRISEIKILKELNPWLRDDRLLNNHKKKYEIKIATNKTIIKRNGIMKQLSLSIMLFFSLK